MIEQKENDTAVKWPRVKNSGLPCGSIKDNQRLIDTRLIKIPNQFCFCDRVEALAKLPRRNQKTIQEDGKSSTMPIRSQEQNCLNKGGSGCSCSEKMRRFN